MTEARRIPTAAVQHLPPAYPERAPRGTAALLRAWQAEALEHYFAREPRDFLAAATPGAGKTTFALRLAIELLARDTVDRVTIVAPTEHLKTQWADAAHRVGLHIDPNYRNGTGWGARPWHGMVVTYAQVATDAALHRRITESGRSLVVLDEVHHGGDARSWGDAVREAFDSAERRLALTGTPFRSDDAPIPFVEYAADGSGARVSVCDYRYGYGRALRDGVVRPVLFFSYAGRMRWRTRTGEEMQSRLGELDTKDVTAQAWRTALDPDGDWIPAVLRAADTRLSEVRHAIPDAGGLVIASDQRTARAYADVLQRITGHPPVLVLSDETDSSQRIADFANGQQRWLVAVRMVSEGVDVPRLAVGVYATNAATPLYFAQAIGRFVRARRRGEIASVFLPTVPVLTALAGELERERDHALDATDERDGDQLLDDDLLREANRPDAGSDAPDEEFVWQALESEANFDRVLYDGDEFGFAAFTGSADELDFLAVPGLLDPDEVRSALRWRQQRQTRRAQTDPRTSAPPAMHRTLGEQRRLLNRLVAVRAKMTGEPHGHVHAQLRRRCGGPAVAQATVDQLQARIDAVREGLRD